MGIPNLAVWKFASCDGCQLSLLDCENELLAIAGAVHIAYFREETRASVEGPYDVSLVDGSVSTPEHLERVRHIREQSRVLVTIGACATAGGVQALRNFADAEQFRQIVYAHPEYLSTLDTSTPIAAHVPVDLQLDGCPIDRRQLLNTLSALLIGRVPDLPTHSVCFECKRRGTPCVLVADGTPCLGPVTRDGCGAICPAYRRGCYGCFGPAATTNTRSLVPKLRTLGLDEADVARVFATFNAAAPAFAAAAGHPAGDGAVDGHSAGPDGAAVGRITSPGGAAAGHAATVERPGPDGRRPTDGGRAS
jgi:sulfhydrogenase subunit delta